MYQLTFPLLLLGVFLVGCHTYHQAPSSITGRWAMMKIYQEGEDVSSAHNPAQDRYIVFKDDGSFESGGTPTGLNTGRFNFDGQEKTLFIDSDAGEEDDSRWKVDVRQDTMVWQGVGTPWATSFKLVFLRD